MVKNPPCNAGGLGLIPGRGTKIPHTLEQLGQAAITTETSRHNLGVQAPQVKLSHDATKIPSAVTKTQHSEINKYFFK